MTGASSSTTEASVVVRARDVSAGLGGLALVVRLVGALVVVVVVVVFVVVDYRYIQLYSLSYKSPIDKFYEVFTYLHDSRCFIDEVFFYECIVIIKNFFLWWRSGRGSSSPLQDVDDSCPTIEKGRIGFGWQFNRFFFGDSRRCCGRWGCGSCRWRCGAGSCRSCASGSQCCVWSSGTRCRCRHRCNDFLLKYGVVDIFFLERCGCRRRRCGNQNQFQV